ncbi:glycosyltransferase family 39 protein [Polymorphobacter megasporae]|uniref:glycosyltransferase family 39 protein n=1 Tax=Glacieibacterium megasporae TaxID=2835787 RepID=UPI001C1E135D|nr:glycosyltransferase family 39 protein [Polymorphobacter megasporae]UAJ09909.1 glycosyltransferase family 39 protein [Polymorphobacter megasporae]
MSAPRTERRLWSRWHTGGALVLAACLAVPVLTIPRHIPLTYNEGWNGYFAARAMAPVLGPLYPAAGELISNNYPPLSFYLIGVAGQLAGDPIVAGRIVALLALLVSGALVVLIVRQLGGRPVWAAAAGLILVAYVVIFAGQYVATNDPQWLAHAVMLGGVATLLASLRPLRIPGIAAAAALVVAALFIKHNLLALPAAATLWLAATDRRAALIWCACGAGAAIIAAAIAYTLFGDALVDSVLHHGRVYDVTRVVKSSWSTALMMPLLGVALLIRWRRNTALALLFVAIALPFGLAQRGGEGVSYNAQFEALIALSIAAGLALSETRRTGVALGAALLPVTIMLPFYAVAQTIALDTLGARTAAWGAIETQIAATPGPVACELLAACFWAGKPFAWDFFNEGQRVRLGAPLAPLATRIASHGFGAIVLTRHPDFLSSDGERLPQPLPRLIDAEYAPVATAPDDTALLLPRSKSR